jgi:hypothetical protein
MTKKPATYHPPSKSPLLPMGTHLNEENKLNGPLEGGTSRSKVGAENQ